MVEVADIPRLAKQARAKLPPDNDDMTEDEFYAWMETLPENEAIAVLVELVEMQTDEREPMANVINLSEARDRIASAPENPIAQALDALALALADHGHKWTDREVRLYETAISYCGCKDSGSMA